jgi:alpha-glucosidase
MMRPLFLEFPEATSDRHPVDLEAGNEFLLGPSILVAPPAFGEMVDSYPLILPSDTWFDYWTGKKIVSKARDLWTSPKLNPPIDVLPVFVRAGSIIPKQSVIQSTEDTPHGPLELYVYPGTECQGTLYLDDGKTFAYKTGAFLRLDFRGESTPEGYRLQIRRREGSYLPWWKEIKITLFDWWKDSAEVRVESDTSAKPASVDVANHSVTFTISDTPGAQDILLTK